MNTPAHLLIGGALFGRHNRPRVTAAALFGAALPDLSLYVLAGTSLFLLDIPPHRVFGELYFSDSWQLIFAIDNSIVLYGVVLLLALWLKAAALQAGAASALIHVLADFALHHDDARRHFFPLSDWVFHSPVSYWDSAHHAGWVAPVAAVLACIAAAVMWRQTALWPMRLAILGLVGAELWVSRQWILFF